MADKKISNLLGVQTENPTSDAKFTLGQRACGHDGTEYIYVRDSGSGVTGAGYVVVITEAYAATMISTSNDAEGDLVGVAPVAVTASYYFWAQVKGVTSIRVAASAAANVRLNTTATAGQLDDDGTTGAFPVTGLYLTTANGGSAGTAAGILNYPIQGAALA